MSNAKLYIWLNYLLKAILFASITIASICLNNVNVLWWYIVVPFIHISIEHSEYPDSKQYMQDKFKYIRYLSDNWDMKGAKHFEEDFVRNVEHIALNLKYTPDVIPKHSGVILLEYKKRNDFVMFEMYPDGKVYMISKIKSKYRTTKWLSSVDEMHMYINDLMSLF